MTHGITCKTGCGYHYGLPCPGCECPEHQIQTLKEALAQATPGLDRIALYNDSAWGPIEVRVAAVCKS